VVDERPIEPIESAAQVPVPTMEPNEDHSHDIYTVANIITVLRLILVPLAFSLLVNGTNNLAAFLVYAFAASTDWLDGQIARRTGTVTEIGKAIDPLVDRLLIASGVIGLYVEGRLPLWTVLVLVLRDVYLLYGAWRLGTRYRTKVPVTYLGKLTTAVLLAGFSLMILDWPTITIAGESEPFGIVLVTIGIILSLTTAVQYTTIARRITRASRAGA